MPVIWQHFLVKRSFTSHKNAGQVDRDSLLLSRHVSRMYLVLNILAPSSDYSYVTENFVQICSLRSQIFSKAYTE